MLYPKHSGVFLFSIAASFFYFFSSPTLSYSQNAPDEADAVFILKGNTRLPSGKGAEGVDLELKKNGQTIQKLLTGKNGKYSVKMNISIVNKNSEYVLYITQVGTIPKSISINTYISPDEYNAKTFPSYLFDLEIKMIETKEKDIVVEKPSGKIIWDNEQHAFAFDQTYAKFREDDTEKLLEEKKKKEEEEQSMKKAEEEARMKADTENKRLADRKSKEEADKILQKNLEAMKLEMRKKRMQDSLDSLTAVNAGKTIVEIKKFSKPVSPDDVDQNAFDGTGAYSINIAKKSLKASQEKMNRKKAANLSAKYETNNTLTSLLNRVDEYEKNEKSIAKSTKQ
ncbi:MAG: hypothetical protein EPN85_04670 [Bacteroidetes bacterium]|nr:MAG: hypothetical protein EPN85_04670 [Bacteroidota bacterium]